jgi:hypothetical protein
MTEPGWDDDGNGCRAMPCCGRPECQPHKDDCQTNDAEEKS